MIRLFFNRTAGSLLELPKGRTGLNCFLLFSAGGFSVESAVGVGLGAGRRQRFDGSEFGGWSAYSLRVDRAERKWRMESGSFRLS